VVAGEGAASQVSIDGREQRRQKHIDEYVDKVVGKAVDKFRVTRVVIQDPTFRLTGYPASFDRAKRVFRISESDIAKYRDTIERKW
jgi:hypothetical protein